jgi:Ca2+-binding EF-hand superfamily protein
MDSFRLQFETELKAKLHQKANFQISEESVLTRAFKYFDLDNSGAVNFEEFKKAIEKIGVTVTDLVKLEQIFRVYDEDRSGELNYKEFVAGVFGQNKRPTTATRRGFTQADQARAEDVVEKIRSKITQRGTRGILGLGRLFKIVDDDNSKSIDLYEFTKVLRDFRLEVTEADAKLVFSYIDRDRSNQIDYDEFLREIRGPINDFRRALVSRAYDKLDATGNGIVDIEDIKVYYNAKGHPDVKAGRKTEEEILLEFLDTFELHHGLLTGERGDRRISREEFDEYYSNVSASIDDDRYFELMMNNTWKLNEAPAYTRNKAWAGVEGAEEVRSSTTRKGLSSAPTAKLSSSPTRSPTRPAKHAEILLERLRTRLAARGARGIIGFGRSFRIMDDDNSRSISKAEFKKASRDFRLDIEDQDVDTLFNVIDRDRSGEIDYDELIRAIRGPLNDFRRGFVQQAWRKLDRDGNGIIEVDDLIGVYSGKMHPEVRAGRKTEEEILGEFLETFEMQLSISGGGTKDQRVTWEEFEEYYCNVSASIDDDRYFETMMVNAWKLNGDSPTKAAWAGSVSQANFNPNHKQQWMADHHRGVLAGSVAKAAPYGTSDDVEWSTTNRPQTSGGLKESIQAKAAGSPTWPGAPQPPRPSAAGSEQLLDTFREKLKGRGARGLIGLARQFKIMDDDNSGALSPQEFRKALRDFRIEVSDDDAQRLFAIFDPDRSGSVDYEEFLHRVRGVLNPARKALVQQVFTRLDRTGDGIVALEDIKGIYNATQHPDVRSGKKTEDEVLGDFLDTFEQHHALFNEGQARDKRVTLDEFYEYYSHISASIDDDRYFELMIKNAWNLEGRSYGKAWGSDNTSPAKRTR